MARRGASCLRVTRMPRPAGHPGTIGMARLPPQPHDNLDLMAASILEPEAPAAGNGKGCAVSLGISLSASGGTGLRRFW
jgi:hypothetical protein